MISLSNLVMFLIAYHGVVKTSTKRIASGFGDYRYGNYHFHDAIDIAVGYGTKVYYPEGEDDNYSAELVEKLYFSSTSTWPNQTKRLVIGRFNFVHLLTDDKKYKPDSVLMKRLGIPRYRWSKITTWKKLWNYCYNNGDKCKWRGGLQVGVVSEGRNSETNRKQHLHFGELLIPNKPISSNLLINPLWEFRGMIVKITMGVYSDENLNKSDGLVVVHYEA